MDLSLLEQAYLLRHEVEKARLDEVEPDFTEIVRAASSKPNATTGSAGTIVKPIEPPNSKSGLEFMARAAALAAAAATPSADAGAGKGDVLTRHRAIVDMLRAASAPLPEFDPNRAQPTAPVLNSQVKPPTTKVPTMSTGLATTGFTTKPPATSGGPSKAKVKKAAKSPAKQASGRSSKPSAKKKPK